MRFEKKRRFEEFIAKAKKKWKEELLNDRKMQGFLYCTHVHVCVCMGYLFPAMAPYEGTKLVSIGLTSKAFGYMHMPKKVVKQLVVKRHHYWMRMRLRLVWETHHYFVKWLRMIKSVREENPKKQLKKMMPPAMAPQMRRGNGLIGVIGLTRESVASHLQKYCQGMQQAEKVIQSTGSFFGSNLTTHLKQNCFSSSRFAQNFNSSQGNTLYLNQLPNLIIFLQPGSDYSCLLHPEASTSTSNMRHEHLLPGTYPFGHSVSPPDPIAQNNTNFFDFGTAQSYSQTGLAQLDSGCVPGINGQSLNDVSAYIGYRLAGTGLSVETGKVVVSGDDENGTEKVSLSAGGSWNESLVQTTLASGNYIPQQQPSQPPVHVVAHDLDNLGAEGDVGCPLDATRSTSPQFFWNDGFNDALFDNTD